MSIAGVLPSASINWFQAAAACANAGKRLLTNQEWQVAAFGTPDPGTDDGTNDCNIDSLTNGLPEDPVNTGSRSQCVSNRGAFDMVGNLQEFVADWGDAATRCTSWSAQFGSDASCVGGDGSEDFPGALIRGGSFLNGTNAGVFAADGRGRGGPSGSISDVGFRCAREL